MHGWRSMSLRRFCFQKQMYPLLVAMCLLSFINLSLLKVRLLDTETERTEPTNRGTAELAEETLVLRENNAQLRYQTALLRNETALLRNETAVLRNETAVLRKENVWLREETVHINEGIAFIRGETSQNRLEVEGILCDKTIEYTPSHTTRIHDVILDPEKVTGKRKGGESIKDVKGQKEENEYFRFRYGLLTVSCNGSSTAKHEYEKIMRRMRIKRPSYIYGILSAIKVSNHELKDVARKEVSGVTVGVCRKDYANLYWTVLELYSAYYTARTSGSPIRETSLLLLDAHPVGKLDEMWQLLFKHKLRLGLLNETVRFTELTLRPDIRLMPIVRKTIPIPYLNDFRYDVTESAGGSPSRTIDCRAVTITFVVRKNYVAHPRNLKGEISRKLINSGDVLSALNSSFPQDKVRGVSFEDLTVAQQIQLSSETDILLGVHGAGLAHTVFQVPGAGLIELFPKEYSPRRKRNPHFQQLAEWSGKFYTSWFSNLTAKHLAVPPSLVTSLVQDMRNNMCAGKQ